MNLLDPLYLILASILIIGYWLVPRIWRLWYLSIGSGLILSFFSWISAIILVVISILTLIALRFPANRLIHGLWGIIILILIFIAYRALPSNNIIIFIGLAFYLLKAIHFLMENYKGHLGKISTDMLFAYLMFFPSLLIGPIHRYKEFQSDWQRQTFDKSIISLALERLIWGYAKLVILADYLFHRKIMNLITTIEPDYPRLAEYLQSLQYGFHLYFSFSGATDIAIALALMLGFRLNENFNNPFLSTNIAEFWRRWHISLSDWCRSYIYQPVASLTRNHQLAIVATMIGIGLWHEFSFRYLLWGGYHAFGLVVYYKFTNTFGETIENSYKDSVIMLWIIKIISILITFNFVILGFEITRSQDIILNYQRLIFGG